MQMTYLEEAKKYEDEFVEDLCGLLEIPSVNGRPEEGKPFGTGCARALDYMLCLARRMGFRTGTVDGYMGYAEYGEGEGEGEEYLAIIGHLDVVPAGDGWHHLPFAGTREGDLLYGRGATDNKGASMTALYTLRLLRDHAVKGKLRVRALFGLDEESGMRDIAYYLTKEAMPAVALVPDAGYPIYNRQRGRITCKVGFRDSGSRADRLWYQNGQAAITLCLEGTGLTVNHFFALGQEYARNTEENAPLLSLREQGENVITLTIHGGKQPLLFLLNLCCKWCPALPGERLMSLFQSFREDPSMQQDWLPQQESREFGEQEAVVSQVDFSGGEGVCTIQLRIPANGDYEKYKAALYRKFEGCTLDFTLEWRPHYVPESHPATRLLAEVYERETGKPAEFLCNVGGNYSRFIDVGFAFGSSFRDDLPANCHARDERVQISKLLKHLAIQTAAAEAMMCALSQENHF